MIADMGGIALSGQVGPTFGLNVFIALAGGWIAWKYRTNQALKEAVAGWRENAEAADVRAENYLRELAVVNGKLTHVESELADLKLRAPALEVLAQTQATILQALEAIRAAMHQKEAAPRPPRTRSRRTDN